MRSMRLATCVLAGLLGLGVFGADSPWSITSGQRMHARVRGQGGEDFRVTLLARSRGRNQAAGRFERRSILLIEGASTGRWVYETQTEGSLDFRRVTSTSTLKRVGGATDLKVTYATEEGEGKGRYQIESPQGVRTVQESELASARGKEATETLSWLSSPLREVVFLLRALAHDQRSWHVEPSLLEPFFGKEDRGPAASLSVESLPVDCTFDASFGFPCDPNERPKAGGKVFVKPLE